MSPLNFIRFTLFICLLITFTSCTKNGSNSSSATPPDDFLSLELCEASLLNQSCSLDEFYQNSFEPSKGEDMIVTKSWRADGDKWVMVIDVLKSKTEKIKMSIWFSKSQFKTKSVVEAVKVIKPGNQDSQDAELQNLTLEYSNVARKVNRPVTGNI